MGDEKIESIERLNETGGNTKTPVKKQCNQRIHWFFTFNNYEENDIETLERHFKEFTYMYCFQEECGEEKHTPHLQGVISCKKPMRWTEFNLNTSIHWERVGNVNKAYEYCSKYETRKDDTKPYTYNYVVKKELRIIKNLYPWQSIVNWYLNIEPDDRKVLWVFGENGCNGKTQLCRYFKYHYNSLFIDEGKKCDIMNVAMKHDFNKHNSVIINVPRDNIDNNGNPNVSYKSIEALKDGIIFSGKYEGGCKIFNSPNIVIFSNYPPEIHKLSLDRWLIFDVENDTFTKYNDRKQDITYNFSKQDKFD